MSDDQLTDDPTINNDAILWRRIHVKQIIFDQNMGRVRPTSAVFDDPEMSVALAAIFFETRDDPASFLKGHDSIASVSFTAGFSRGLGQGVIPKPLPDEPAHAEVIGAKPKSIQRKFAKSDEIRWVVRPPMGIVEEIKNKS